MRGHKFNDRFRQWLLADTAVPHGRHAGPHGRPHHQQRSHWLRVMCLTGLDYFSTLGYQPAIAALAAGAVAPIATLVLVIVTCAAALPVYRRVARESPHGAGSIAMLAKLLPWWTGKLIVLALLGFALTDFIITMTLSASDASAHLTQNPFISDWVQGKELSITLVLLGLVGLLFLRGFRRAIWVATILVSVFLTVNVVVIIAALVHIFDRPTVIDSWWTVLVTQHGDPLFVIAIALLVFPKLALGLSGFETGVVVMPQIQGDRTDTEAQPLGRIRRTHRLLTTSAVMMSSLLITSSFTTVALIPAEEFQEGGRANGRALAYLAHEYLGSGFGTFYDLSTIGILCFAGASAMAGLLNLVPRYLPHYGMAPAWTRTTRPLVLVFTGIAGLVTVVFQANVTAQGGAYATGVLVLITSAAFAVTLAARRTQQRAATVGFGAITVVFVYTTIANIIERPDGLKIAGCFIVAIVLVGFVSRAVRSTELRATSVQLDPGAETIMTAGCGGVIRLVANDPATTDAQRYLDNLQHAGLAHRIPNDEVVFIEVVITDSSEFETDIYVSGMRRHGNRILVVHAGTISNAIAAVSLYLQDTFGCVVHVYFRWTEGTPLTNFFRFLLFGDGAIATMTHEILREAEADVHRRPWIHVA